GPTEPSSGAPKGRHQRFFSLAEAFSCCQGRGVRGTMLSRTEGKEAREPNMPARDDIGSHGEYIFCTRIMDFCDRDLLFFRPRFLGEKARTLDYLVELVSGQDRAHFFFVQVRATRKGYTRSGKRLKIGMSASAVRRFALIPAPTYLVGIDEPREIGYILAI